MAVDWLAAFLVATVTGAVAMIIVSLAALSPSPDIYEDGVKPPAKRSGIGPIARIGVVLFVTLASSTGFSLIALQLLQDESVIAVHMLQLQSLENEKEIKRSADYAAKLFTLGGQVQRIFKPEIVREPEGRSCIRNWDVILYVRHNSIRRFRTAWSSRQLDEIDLPDVITNSYTLLSQPKSAALVFMEALFGVFSPMVYDMCGWLVANDAKSEAGTSTPTCSAFDLSEEASQHYSGKRDSHLVVLSLFEQSDGLTGQQSSLLSLKQQFAQLVDTFILPVGAGSGSRVLSTAEVDTFRLCIGGESHPWHSLRLIEFPSVGHYLNLTKSRFYNQIQKHVMRGITSKTTMLLSDL